MTHCEQTASTKLAGKVLTPLHSWAAPPTLELMSLWGCWPTQVQGLALKSILQGRSTESWHHRNHNETMCSLIRDSFQQVFAVAGPQRPRKKDHLQHLKICPSNVSLIKNEIKRNNYVAHKHLSGKRTRLIELN